MRWPIRRTADHTQGRAGAPPGRNGGADRLLPPSRLEAFSDGVFAIAITLLVLELHVPNGHVAADDVAEEELQAFSRERRAAAAFQGGATVLGAFLPVVAIGFYLAVSLVFIVEPLRRVRIRARAPSSPDELAEPSAPSSGP